MAVLLLRLDPELPSNLGRAYIYHIHVQDVALRFCSLKSSDGPTKIEDLCSSKIVKAGQG